MSCFFLATGEDSQVKSNNLEDSIVDGDADSSRTFENTSCAADASDEGPPLHEQAHVAPPEEVGEEEVHSMFRIQISNCSFCIASLCMQTYVDVCFFKHPTTIFAMVLVLGFPLIFLIYVCFCRFYCRFLVLWCLRRGK